MTKKSPKILLWDVETTHNIVATFPLFKANISHTCIIQEWFMLCAAWKWLGKNNIESVSLLDDPVRFQEDHTDDYYVIAVLHSVLSEADAVIAHNGDNFDMKKFNARAIQHGFPPLQDIVQIDTLKMARRKFKFNWNRLDYLGEYLGLGRKLHTDVELWLKCLKGNKKALREMLAYNKQDITLLEKVYLKLRPWLPAHLNFNIEDNRACPKCGSFSLRKEGTGFTKTRKFQKYKCSACMGWSRSTISVKGVKAEVK